MPVLGTSGSLSTRAYQGLSTFDGFSVVLTIASNTNNYSVRSSAIAEGWDGVEKLQATVIIRPNVIVGSTNNLVPSFDTGPLPAGSEVILINSGSILGRGGNGGSAGVTCQTGSAGGLALNTQANIIIQNLAGATIGGGGGGGGAGSSLTTVGGSGGGGGRGFQGGTAGLGAGGSLVNGNSGTAGTATTAGIGGGSGATDAVTVTLSSGTEFTNSAVYTSSLGSSAYWYSINLAGTVSGLGQASTQSYNGLIGLKLFASVENSANPAIRSNYVGQYFWQDFTAGNTKATATVPATIPGVSGSTAINSTIFNLVGYLWGATGRHSTGTNGGGGYTDFVGPITPNATLWVICGGGGYRTGIQDSSRDADCKGKAFQGGWTDCGGGLSGVFTADPLDASNVPLLTATSTAILGIAGGGGACYNGGTSGGGGGTTGQASSASNAGGGGTQSAGGANATDNTIRDADFMTGSVVGQNGSGGSGTAGGGGGYYGGGGTWRNGPTGSCGGGGGSGYFRITGGYSGQTIQATDRNAANNASNYYPGNNVGFGLTGGSDQGTGNRGQVRLYLR